MVDKISPVYRTFSQDVWRAVGKEDFRSQTWRHSKIWTRQKSLFENLTQRGFDAKERRLIHVSVRRWTSLLEHQIFQTSTWFVTQLNTEKRTLTFFDGTLGMIIQPCRKGSILAVLKCLDVVQFTILQRKVSEWSLRDIQEKLTYNARIIQTRVFTAGSEVKHAESWKRILIHWSGRQKLEFLWRSGRRSKCPHSFLRRNSADLPCRSGCRAQGTARWSTRDPPASSRNGARGVALSLRRSWESRTDPWCTGQIYCSPLFHFARSARTCSRWCRRPNMNNIFCTVLWVPHRVVRKLDVPNFTNHVFSFFAEGIELLTLLKIALKCTSMKVVLDLLNQILHVGAM